MMRSSEMSGDLIRGVSGSFGVQVIGMVLSLASGVVLARALGVTSYGYYAYALAWLELFKVPVVFGYPLLIQRELAVLSARGEWGVVRGLLRRTNQSVLAIAVVLVIGVLAVGRMSTNTIFGNPQQFEVLEAAVLMLPMLGVSGVRIGALNGLHRATQGLLPENIVRPLVALLGVGALWSALGQRVTPEQAMIVQVGALAVSFAVGAILLKQALPSGLASHAHVYRSKEWLKAVLPFLLTGGAFAVWGTLGVLFLGHYRTPAEVGVYRVATTVAMLTQMPVMACNITIAPLIARLYAERQHARLQTIVSWSTIAMVVTSLAALLGCLVVGHFLLGFVFGSQFAQGYPALVVLVVGYFAYSTIWTVMVTCDMTGHQRFSLYSLLSSAALNLLLASILIPKFGMTGAAAATTLSWFLGHLWLVPVLRRKTGLHTTVIFALAQARVAVRAHGEAGTWPVTGGPACGGDETR